MPTVSFHLSNDEKNVFGEYPPKATNILTFFWYILETVSLYLVSIHKDIVDTDFELVGIDKLLSYILSVLTMLVEIDLQLGCTDQYLISIEEKLVDNYLKLIGIDHMGLYFFSIDKALVNINLQLVDIDQKIVYTWSVLNKS